MLSRLFATAMDAIFERWLARSSLAPVCAMQRRTVQEIGKVNAAFSDKGW